jgi:hypothetical protein
MPDLPGLVSAQSWNWELLSSFVIPFALQFQISNLKSQILESIAAGWRRDYTAPLQRIQLDIAASDTSVAFDLAVVGG